MENRRRDSTWKSTKLVSSEKVGQCDKPDVDKVPLKVERAVCVSGNVANNSSRDTNESNALLDVPIMILNVWMVQAGPENATEVEWLQE